MKDARPNIIFIITDQQRYDTIGALGSPYMDTPVLDKLVEEGTSFTQCHVAAVSCAPSRGALFTGMYPHTTGIVANGDTWRKTWVELLTNAGYHTVNIGKMHTEPMDTPAGFSERFNVENKERARRALGVNRDYLDEWDRALGAHGLPRPEKGYYRDDPEFEKRLGAFDWPLEEKMHPDIFTANLALWWLKRKPVTEPLFLQIGFPGPHPPYDPLPGTAAGYMERDLRIRPVDENDLSNQPPPMQELRQAHMDLSPDSTSHRPDASLEDRKRQRACYLANQTMIDRKIGEILEVLEEQGYLENSIIVYTSDHGDCLGDHGLSQKWSFYDQITRVPLIVCAPGRVPENKKIDGLVQQQDISQWLLEQASVPVPSYFETESIEAAFKTSDFCGRDAVYAEHGRDRYFHSDFGTMIRTNEWKCICFAGEKYGQLFDLNADPHEETNLWGDPDVADIRRELLDRIAEWRIYSQLRTKDWAVDFR